MRPIFILKQSSVSKITGKYGREAYWGNITEKYNGKIKDRYPAAMVQGTGGCRVVVCFKEHSGGS